jgi:hypothetical protein
MNCIKCGIECVNLNSGTEEKPLCSPCYDKIAALYSDAPTGEEFKKLNAKYNFKVKLGLFAFIAGSFISIVNYINISASGSYFITTGAIIWGFIYTIQGYQGD